MTNTRSGNGTISRMIQDKDYYTILGLHPDAEPEIMRKVYIALAQKFHPDNSDGQADEERLKKINEAYAVLKDASTRKEYDALLASKNTKPDESSSSYRSSNIEGDTVKAGTYLAVVHCFKNYCYADQLRPELYNLGECLLEFKERGLMLPDNLKWRDQKIFELICDLRFEAYISQNCPSIGKDDRSIIDYIKKFNLTEPKGKDLWMGDAPSITAEFIDFVATFKRDKFDFSKFILEYADHRAS